MIRRAMPLLTMTLTLLVLLACLREASGQTEDREALQQRVQALYQQGRYAEAVPLAERLVSLCEKELGPEHPDTAACINNLANLYSAMGDYARAEPLYKRALAIFEKVFGEHPKTAVSLNNLANLYQNMGDYVRAEPLYLHALGIWEKVAGPEHLEKADSLTGLAKLYKSVGNYSRAEPLYKRALAVVEKVLGPEHLETAGGLNNLANLYQVMGDYALAEPLYKRALAIRETALGPEHPDTASSLNDLANLYSAMGDFPRAEPLYKRALAIQRKVLGPEHPETAYSLHNLALLYDDMGDFAQAEVLYRRALDILEKALGPENPDIADNLDSLANLYSAMGDYARAEPLFQRSLAIREKVYGPENDNTSASLNNLANLYSAMGDYSRAELMYKRALTILETALGPEHPDTASCINNLADLYSAMGDYARAEPLLQRALAIREKTLGPENPKTAVSLNNLAELYYLIGDYARAEPKYEHALKIAEKALGPEHPITAFSLNGLANVSCKMGDYARAGLLYKRALASWEKALGLEHPHTADSLNSLAMWQLDTGNLDEAVRLATRELQARDKTLANVLSFTSERQRLAFQASLDPYSLLATSGAASELALSVLRHKGVVLDSLLEDIQVTQAAGGEPALTELRSAKERLFRLTLETPKDVRPDALKRRVAEREALENQVEQMEGALARQVTGLGRTRRALQVTVKQIQDALPEDGALVEYLRYQNLQAHTAQYGAIVLLANEAPVWVPLGPASTIEEQIQNYQRSVRARTSEAALSNDLKSLYLSVWAPLERHLPATTRTVIVSPDASLSFVSLATLLTPEDQFLGQRYTLRYVGSGRDLLNLPGSSSAHRVVAVGSPDFLSSGLPIASATATSSQAIQTRDLSDLAFSPLPGTVRECEDLEDIGKKAGWKVDVYIGQDATEPQLRRVGSPWILHLATHGFFLPEEPIAAPTTGSFLDPSSLRGVRLVNPMRRSGLALAGAQTTLEAWKHGATPDPDQDGVLTADEVSLLNLRETWLVTLSACETGLGEARSGEGVLGLRRGFVQAGAQNLLMTLWPVDDRFTTQFMEEFYEAAQNGGNAPVALAKIQRDELVALRQKRGLLAAVNLAGPFVMTFQGKP